ncbi:putative phage holin [Streptomyces sp. NPDC002248]
MRFVNSLGSWSEGETKTTSPRTSVNSSWGGTMTPGQIANAIASSFVALSAGGFVLFYTLRINWWKNSTGRFLAIKGVGITLTGLLTVGISVSGFGENADWMRFVQAILWVTIGITYHHYLYLIYRGQKRKEEE